MRKRKKVLPSAEPKGNSCERNRHGANQNRSTNTTRHKDGNQKEPGDGQQKFPVADLAKTYERSGICDNNFCVAKADERDE